MKTQESYFLKLNGNNHLGSCIRLRGITVIELHKHRLFIKTKERIYSMRDIMSDLTRRLEKYGFIRINRTQIVHIDCIKSIDIDFTDIEVETTMKNLKSTFHFPIGTHFVKKIKKGIRIFT